MRVPTKFLFDTRKDTIIENQAKLFELQKKVSSGLKLARPSDNPSEYSLARTIEVHISKIARDISDSNEVLHFLKAKEEALSKLSDLLAKAKMHAERGIDAISSEEFASLASAVEELFTQAVQIANTSVRGRFIFGGTKIVPILRSFKAPYEDREVVKQESWESQKGIETTKNLGQALGIKEGRFRLVVYDDNGNEILSDEIRYFDTDTIQDIADKINARGGGLVIASTSADGKLIVNTTTPGFTFSILSDNMGLIAEIGGDGIPEYHGNDEVTSVEIQSALVNITTVGREIFGDPSKGVMGVLTTLKKLSDILRFKVEGNTQELLRAMTLEIEKMYEVVNEERTKLGENISLVEKRLDLLNFAKTEETIRKSEIEDLDMAEGATELTLRESIVQASMITAVRAFELTLMRFL